MGPALILFIVVPIEAQALRQGETVRAILTKD
jgi:hypothetical protein